jgi:ribosomal protein S18 acetylase RimI-like enzyme
LSIVVDAAKYADLTKISRVFATILKDNPYYNALAKKSERAKYTRKGLIKKLADDPWSILVARNGVGKIVGFCFNHFDDFTIWIDWFGVTSDSRKQGVGTSILTKTFETARKRGAHKVWCDTRANNEPSKNLLTKLGFRRLVEIKNHWYGQDFILWEKFA